jgi:hypothetical protein
LARARGAEGGKKGLLDPFLPGEPAGRAPICTGRGDRGGEGDEGRAPGQDGLRPRVSRAPHRGAGGENHGSGQHPLWLSLWVFGGAEPGERKPEGSKRSPGAAHPPRGLSENLNRKPPTWASPWGEGRAGVQQLTVKYSFGRPSRTRRRPLVRRNQARKKKHQEASPPGCGPRSTPQRRAQGDPPKKGTGFPRSPAGRTVRP